MLVGLSAAIALGCADGVDTASAVHGSVTGVGDGKANTIQVTPSSASVLRGASTSLKCLALDSRGVVVSSTQTWSIADPGVAAVDATGSIIGQRGGTTMASCMVEGKAASSVITVIESPVSFLEMTPGADALVVGTSAQLTGTPLDSTDAALAGYPVQWTTPDTSVAYVSASGMVVARGEGTANVIATSGGQTSFAKISVSKLAPSPVSNVSIDLSTSTLAVGQVVHTSATTTDSTGRVLTGRGIVWTSSNSSVFTVVTTGPNNVKVTGRTAGSARLIATSEGKSTSMPLTVGTAPVQTVTVSLASPSLLPGQTTQAAATLTDAVGNVLTGRAVTWSSLDPTIASVSAAGVVTAVGTGSVIIRATSEGKTGDATLTIGVDPVASVTVSVGSVSLTAGQTTQASAVARDAIGNVLNGRTVAWSSLNTNIATVSISGVVTAVAAGTATIRATVESQTGDAPVTVAAPQQDPPSQQPTSPAPPPAPTTASVVVTLDSLSMVVGHASQAHAVAKDAQGNVLSGKSVTWSSLNPSIASVASSGVVTAKAAGPASIQATIDNINGSAALVVNAPPPPTTASVVVTLDSASLLVGHTSQAHAVAKDAQGNVLSAKTATWTASNPTVASVSSSGLVTAQAAGTVSIQATIDGVNGSASLTVNASPPPPATTASVAVTLDSASMVVGHTTQAHAVAKDSKGNVISGKTATWTSGSTTVASVATAGVVTAKGAGTSSIQATIDGINGAASLTVAAAPAPPPSQTGLPAEPFFDASTGTMIYATNFDNYTYAMLHPTCGSATPAQQIIDHAWYYCSTFTTNGQPGYDAGVVMVPGHSGQAVQFHYDGVLQESHGIELTGGTNTGSATSIIQHWGRLVADPGAPPITDTVVAAKIKWIELWHNDPGNNRIQFNLVDHVGGCPWYGPAYVDWGVYDMGATQCNGQQAVHPSIGDVANGQWHRFTYLTKPNSCAGCRDGRALMWIDGQLVIRIEQSAVDVVVGSPNSPRTKGQPWCQQGDVDALAVGYGIQSPEWGGPLTNGNIPFTIAIDDLQWWTLK